MGFGLRPRTVWEEHPPRWFWPVSLSLLILTDGAEPVAAEAAASPLPGGWRPWSRSDSHQGRVRWPFWPIHGVGERFGSLGSANQADVLLREDGIGYPGPSSRLPTTASRATVRTPANVIAASVPRVVAIDDPGSHR